MVRRKVLAVALVAGVAGIVIGMLLGPHINVFFWSAVLDRHPNVAVKNRAALHLKDSELGKQSLRNHLTSSDRMIRLLSTEALAYFGDPEEVLALLERVPESRVDQRLDIIRGLSDYPLEYRTVLAYLDVELKNDRNDRKVLAEIRNLLYAIKQVEKSQPEMLERARPLVRKWNNSKSRSIPKGRNLTGER